MISSWEKTLKWAKHKVGMAYQSKKHMWKVWHKFFKDNLRLGKDFKIGEAGAINFVIWKSTIPIKVVNVSENYGTSFLGWFQVGQRL